MLIARIDKARKELREDRSVFVIQSVIERLKKLGYYVPEHFEPKNIPPRTTDFSYLLKDEPLSEAELEQKRQEEERARLEAAGLPDDLFEGESERAAVRMSDEVPFQGVAEAQAVADHKLTQGPVGVIAAGTAQDLTPVRYRNAPRAKKSQIKPEDKK